jgi:hypothetical protein
MLFLVTCYLSLVPCATQDEEPEVEHLLRLHEAAELDALPVLLPELPDSASMPMRRVAELYALVRGLRLAAGDDRDVPFAGRWVAAKVRLPHRTVARALRDLVAHGVLVSTGSMPGRGSRGTSLFAPGEGNVVSLTERRQARV